MTTHTPGPWEIVREDLRTLLKQTGKNGVYLYSLNECPGLGLKAKPTARLIAAAPTMHDYIAKRAAAGDAEAAQILGGINGNA